jgi:tetratricopeptide (TPR) repeat protein
MPAARVLRSAASLLSQLSTINPQLITLLCAFAILFFATGCSRSAKVERHLARGQEFFKAEQYDKAEIDFLNVLRLEQTNAIALRDLGLTYYQQGRWLRSYAFLQKANEINPGNNEVRLRLASILVGLRNAKDARPYAQAVLAQDRTNEEALMLLAESTVSSNDVAMTQRQLDSLRSQAENKAGFHLALGIVEMRQGHTNNASAAFQRALSLDPKSSHAHLALGNLAVLALDNTQADLHFKKGAELAPVRSARRLQYADFKLRSGETAAAKAFLQEMAREAPDYLPTSIRLAEIALDERQFDVAASLVRNILNRDPGNYDAMLLQGRVSLAKGQPSQALADFERVVSAYARVPQAHFYLAVAQRLNTNDVKAIASLRQAIALDPKNSESILLLAEMNIRKGDVDAAIPALKQLIKEQPNLAQAHLLLATAYRGQRELETAAGVYKNMINVFPRNPQPYLLLGQVLLLQQKKDEARKQFEKATEIAPDFLLSLDELVDLDIGDKQFSTARARVQRHIDRHPKKPDLHLLLAKIYSAEKNDSAAEAALSQAIVLDPDYQPAYLALARLYVSANKHQAALDKIKIVLAKSTNDLATLMLAGMIHTELKDYRAAHDAYQRLLAVNPRFGPALNNLADICSEYLNLPDKAFEYARAARDVAPSDPVPADTLGWILFKRGEYARALTLLQESIDKKPQEPEIWFHLGMTHYMLGDEQPARTAFERAIQSGRPFRGKDEAQRRLDLLSGAAADLKDVAALEGYIKANPRDPFVLVRLARLYEQSGAFDKAATAYNDVLKSNARNVSAMLQLARLYAGPLRDIEKATQIAQDARRVAPEDPQVGHALARLAFQVGNHPWALSLLQESALKLADDPEVFYDLAWSSYSMGQLSNANDAMKKALGLGKQFSHTVDAKRFLELNTVALQPGNAVASPQVAAALKDNPSYVPALFASGLLEERNGAAAAARDAYSKVIKTFPSFVPAHKRLAILLSSSPSDSAAAYEHATKAREGLPDDPEVARTLGILSFQRKEYSRAASLLAESSRKRPNDAEVFYYLGVAQSHLKQKNESRLALERALALGTNATFVSDAKRILAELK